MFNIKKALTKIMVWVKEKGDLIGNSSMGTSASTITGAIAEHESDISNLNSKIPDEESNCIKFQDGTMIQWGRIPSMQRAATQTGYSWNAIINSPVTFSPAFIEIPRIIVNNDISSDSLGAVIGGTASKTGITKITIARFSSGDIYAGFNWIAIGKWK